MSKPISYYGIQSFKIKPAILSGENVGSLPDFDDMTDGYEFTAIADASVSINQTEASKNEIFIENARTAYMTLDGTPGSKSIVLSSYDHSPEAQEYLFGSTIETDSDGNTVIKETPNFKLGNQAVEIVTLAQNGHPSRRICYANVEASVIETGTIGRGGLSSYQVTLTIVSNYNKDGKVIGNKEETLLEK